MFAAGTVKCVAETSNVRGWEQIQVFTSGTVKYRKYNVLQKAVMLRANTGVCAPPLFSPAVWAYPTPHCVKGLVHLRVTVLKG